MNWLGRDRTQGLRPVGDDRPAQPGTEPPEIAESCPQALPPGFPGEYWRRLDRGREYPTQFVRTLTEAGLPSG